jgi:hypothetical protein
MNAEFEREAVEVLADFADHWAHAPMLGELPAVVGAIDQFGAQTLESMSNSGMTESEKIALALGYYLASRTLHDQLEGLEMHEGAAESICETTGLFAGAVAAQALAPKRRGG